MAAEPVPAGTRPAPTWPGQFRVSFKPPVPVAPPPRNSSDSSHCHSSAARLFHVTASPSSRLCRSLLLRAASQSEIICAPSGLQVFSNYFMASNAREDTQSNSVAPNDNEIEVQSNANPTLETSQATDNVSTPKGSTPNEGDNKTHVKSAYWEYFDRLKVEGEWKAKCKFCKIVFSANPKNGTKSLRNHVDRYCKRIKVANSR
ncbi:uncharacterized protein LOC130935209 [Arachis stenosperma]|uniref:uncharacterized protein LOC130935209 n=1 Tax=Arachis stenosperma TaxID=217475 RepID=UPI0025ABA17E|nr:uncharacterized protein LOC130935209 [Arachis stenosperma]